MLWGMTGRAQAGKDTAFLRLGNLLAADESGGIVVERASFAAKLYASAAASLGVTVEQLLEWKTMPNVRIEVVRYQANSRRMRGGSRIHSCTVRQYLQWYGTEGHRMIFGTDFWVEAVEGLGDHDGKLVVITDTRFENEAAAIRAAGGKIVRVLGPDEVEGTEDAHESEAGFPEELIDATLDNSNRDDGFASLDAQLLAIYTGQELLPAVSAEPVDES